MTKLAQIFALGIILYATAAGADMMGASSMAPTTVGSPHKRSAEVTTSVPSTSTGGRQKRGVSTSATSDATKSVNKRHAHGSTAVAAEADATTPMRSKREAITIAATTFSGSSKKRSVDVESSSPLPSMTPRPKRSDMTYSTILTSTASKEKRSAENTTPTSTTARVKREDQKCSGTTPNGRKKRNVSYPITATPTGAPRKREAGTTSSVYPSTLAGRQKREASTATVDATAMTTMRHKRSAEASSTVTPFTTVTAGRRKREATTITVTGSSSSDAPKKRHADPASPSPLVPETSRSPSNQRSSEGTTVLSTIGPKKREAPARVARLMNSPNPAGMMMPLSGQTTMVGPAGVTMPAPLGQPGQPISGQPEVPRQRRHAKRSSLTPSTADDVSSEEVTTEATEIKHKNQIKPLFPPPQFIKDLSPEQRRQFFEIKSNFTLTKKEIHAQLQKWIQQQPANVQADYETFHNNLEKIKNDISQKIQFNLSTEGKALFNKIKSYMDDDSLTMRQTCENIQRAIEAAPEHVRDELHCNEHMPMPSGGITSTPRRVDACHGHFSERLRALVTGAPPVNPQPVLLAATAK